MFYNRIRERSTFVIILSEIDFLFFFFYRIQRFDTQKKIVSCVLEKAEVAQSSYHNPLWIVYFFIDVPDRN